MLEQLLKTGFEEMGLACDEQCLSRYRVYFENLEESNKVMNLTAISGEEDVARLHFLDCAAVLKMEDFAGKRVIDVGTGAGFPGLAMKIACPEMELTLLDSLDKRINFLKDTCAKTGIEDVTCIHARAEEIPEGYRESFDFATARAVAEMRILCELCMPFVKVGGAMLAMKGKNAEFELAGAKKAISLLGGELKNCESVTLKGGDEDFTHPIIEIKKKAKTPAAYPRAYAQISKKPL
jgi:16S rRNA (guanine527-N7)-methyltransferase